MKKNLLTILLIFLTIQIVAQTAFLNTYPFDSGNPFKITQTNDNGYFFVTGTGSSIFLTKTNAWGNILFQKALSYTGFNMIPRDIIQTSDSGFVIPCYKSNNTSVVIKTDLNGNFLWGNEIYLPNHRVNANKVLQDSEDNLIIFAFSLRLTPTSQGYGSIIKLSNSGNLLLSKSYYRTNAAGNSIHQVTGAITKDKGFILHGTDGWTWIKTDSLGNLQWTFKSPETYSSPVIDTSVFNQYFLSANVGGNLYIEKMDSSGTLLWRKLYSHANVLSNFYLKTTFDGGFLVLASGATQGFPSYVSYPFLLKCDSSGLLQSSVIPFDTVQFPWGARDLKLTNDTGFICSFAVDVNNIAVKKYSQLSFNTCNDFFLPIQNLPPSSTISTVAIDTLSLFFQIITDSLITSNYNTSSNLICSNISLASNVYPGDCNYDLTVNNIDFLYLNIANSDTGSPRINPSINFTPQLASDWVLSFTSGANHKHADTDGNGIVELDDTTAILQNYNLQHPFRFSQNQTANSLPVFYIHALEDTIAAGDTIHYEIKLSNFPLDSLYGIAYSLYYNLSLVDSTAIQFNYSNSALGILNSDMAFFEKTFYSNGIIDAALCRYDHNNVTNVTGTLGTLSVKSESSIYTLSYLNLKPVFAKGITASESNVHFDLLSDTVVIYSTVGINELQAANFSISPNPSNGSFKIIYLLPQNKSGILQIFDITGKEVYKQNLPQCSTLQNISLPQLSSGVYAVKINSDNFSVTKKLLIQQE